MNYVIRFVVAKFFSADRTPFLNYSVLGMPDAFCLVMTTSTVPVGGRAFRLARLAAASEKLAKDREGSNALPSE